MSTVALLLAAGTGSRLAESTPKAFLPLVGRPMLFYSLDAMAGSAVVDMVIAVVPSTFLGEAEELLGRHPTAETARGSPGRSLLAAVVAGGTTRQDSVRLGLEAAAETDADVVVCHDAARPFASPALFDRVVGRLHQSTRLSRADTRTRGDHAGVVPVVPTPDTVKRVRGGRVVETLPRDHVLMAQTPQAFVRGALEDAHRRAIAAGGEATDDAALLEAAGLPVDVVEGEAANFKVTTALDLDRAAGFLSTRPAGAAASGAELR